MSDRETPAPRPLDSVEPEAGLEILMFGPIEVRIGSQPLPRLRSRKGFWLLALLALRGGCDVDRGWLAGTLWPDGDEAHARRSLRQSLHDLRLALGGEADRLTEAAPRTLRLDVAGARVDVLQFDGAAARGDLDSLAAAVALYRGPLLEGCLEEWCLVERRRREETCLAALERLAAAARHQPAVAASYLRQAVGIDPYREELQQALMETLAASGNPAAALLAYREFDALLRREMTAKPSEKLTALFRRLRDETRSRPEAERTDDVSERIRERRARAERSEARTQRRSTEPISQIPAHNPPAARVPGSAAESAVVPHPPLVSAPCHLPLPLTPLIGREEAVREVICRLNEARLVTLTGTGGVGKTRLALHVAEQLADQYEHGAHFVDLAPLVDPALAPEAIRAALGLVPGDARQEPLAALRQYLSPLRLLLVLDNCEHLLEACAALARSLLGHCPGLRLLATSRQPLGLCGETIWRVPSLALPGAQALQCSGAQALERSGVGTLGPGSGEREHAPPPRTPERLTVECPNAERLLQYPAVQLFVERARAAEASFVLTPENAGAILQICRRVDGIPLAIELAAARVRSVCPREIASRLRDGLGMLASSSPTLGPRQRTMAAIFDWSWDLLSPAGRTLLGRLSVFPGGWTLQAAEAVCSDSGLEEVLDLLSALVDRSLVLYRPAVAGTHEPGSASGEPRYYLLETVRQYAAQRLEQSGEREAVQERHRDYFLTWAEAIKPKLWGAEQALWFARLAADHDNLRTALEFCRARGEVEAELRLAVALSRFWDTCGHLREGRANLEAALGRMRPDLPYLLRHNAHVHAGWIAHVQGDSTAAQAHYEQALSISREHHHQPCIAYVLNLLAVVFSNRGDLAGARALYEESLALYRELGGSGYATLSNLGELALRQGDLEAARRYLEQSAPLCAVKGDRQQHGLVLHSLSIVALQQARYEEARRHAAASLRLLYDCGAVINLPAGLDQMAAVAHAHGEWERAARLLGAAAGLREAAGLETSLNPERSAAHAAARRALGEDAFAALFAEGQAMGLEAAVAHALG